MFRLTSKVGRNSAPFRLSRPLTGVITHEQPTVSYVAHRACQQVTQGRCVPEHHQKPIMWSHSLLCLLHSSPQPCVFSLPRPQGPRGRAQCRWPVLVAAQAWKPSKAPFVRAPIEMAALSQSAAQLIAAAGDLPSHQTFRPIA